MTISWSVPVTMYAAMFRVEIDGPNGDVHYVYPSLAGSTVDVEDIIPGTWVIRVYSLGLSGAKSEPALLEYNASGWAGVDLPEIKNLRLASPFTTADCSIVWKNHFPNAPTNNPMFKWAEVKVYAYINTVKTLRRSEYVFGNSYSYSFAMNEQDGTPARQLIFEVSATDIYDRTGAAAELTATNDPISAPTVEVTAGIGSIVISYNLPSEEDYVKTKVWVSETQGFDTGTTPPTYEGASSFHAHPVGDTNPRYIRVAHIDNFSEHDFLTSSELAASALIFELDTDAPSIPTGLAVSSAIVNEIARVVVAWNANTEADLAGYDLQIREGSGNWVSFMLVNNNYEFDGKPGLAYQFRLRSRDKMGNTSGYTNTVNHIAAKDTIPPAAPTNLQVTGGFNTIWLTWKKNSESDFSHYEIYEAATVTPAPNSTTQAQYATTANSFVRSSLGENEKKYFWVRALDTSGNKSAWVATSSTTTTNPGVTAADLEQFSFK